jgi:two-component system OmpR family sensor kinase
MFRSVRARLTTWYTGVLALVLLAFAFATYFFFQHTISARSDEDLAELTGAFAETLRAEQSDLGENGGGQSGAFEAIREFRFRDHQFYVLDDHLQLVGSTAALESSLKNRPSVSTAPIAMASLLRLVNASAADGHPLATVREDHAAFRAYVESVQVGSQQETIVVARSLRNQEAVLRDFREGLFIAIPLALLFASAGGYFLARKSLTPVMVMSERVAHMGAADLKDRLPVANPSDELGRLAQVFNELLARLDASFEQQRRFMADASHELRTPIAIVRGEAEVALSKPQRQEAEYRESLAIVGEEGRRLTQIVEDLLILARADAGQYPIHFKKHSLDEVMVECVRSVRTLAQKHGVSLCFEPPAEMPFLGDEELLRRMCVNLLDNAIKFTPSGGLVKVSCDRRNGEYVLTVSDTGHGIPREDQGRVFERFYRVDKTRSRPEEGFGAGLGLPIAQWIAEAHHGRLELLHSDSTGSTFAAHLPVSGGSTAEKE